MLRRTNLKRNYGFEFDALYFVVLRQLFVKVAFAVLNLRVELGGVQGCSFLQSWDKRVLGHTNDSTETLKETLPVHLRSPEKPPFAATLGILKPNGENGKGLSPAPISHRTCSRT